jgi:tripartite-type tricarboxylate transporter receptor subunit TctC
MNRKTLRNANRGKMVQEQKSIYRGQALQWVLMTVGTIVGAVLLIGAMVIPLGAQSYPNKPIRLILPMAVGGSVDIMGRIVAQKLAERLGQPVVPENHGGASGTIGNEIVAKAKPDGYTLLIGSPSSMGSTPGLFKRLNYDPINGFAPISLIAQLPNVLVIRASIPVNSLKELVEYAKANPGKLNYGSTGIGSSNHFATELLKSLTKINIVHVPYKSAGQAMIGLMNGETDILMSGIPPHIPQIQAGRVRPLAVVSDERVPLLPNVPTVKEAGIDNFDVVFSYGILTTVGTPRNIVNRLNAEWIQIAKMPDTIEKMQKTGVDPTSSTPEQYFKLIKADVERWTKVAKEANITID